MRKLMVLCVVIVFGSTCSIAQSNHERPGITFSVGAEPAIPVGLFGTVTTFIIGGSLQGEKHLNSDVSLTLLSGYSNIRFKNFDSNDGSFKSARSSGMIPVLAGVKYYVKPNLYGHAQLGLSFSTESGGGTNFTYSPGIGMNISEHFDAELKYTAVTTGVGVPFGTLGLRVAYNF